MKGGCLGAAGWVQALGDRVQTVTRCVERWVGAGWLCVYVHVQVGEVGRLVHVCTRVGGGEGRGAAGGVMGRGTCKGVGQGGGAGVDAGCRGGDKWGMALRQQPDSCCRGALCQG